MLVGSRTESVPSKLNADPDLPAANAAPFTSVPWLPSTMSRAVPSAFHHDTNPDGRVLPFNSTPSPALPLMTFPAPAAVPPTVFPIAPAWTRTPSSALASFVAPDTSMPT